jgi:hypothetical protein
MEIDVPDLDELQFFRYIYSSNSYRMNEVGHRLADFLRACKVMTMSDESIVQNYEEMMRKRDRQ